MRKYRIPKTVKRIVNFVCGFLLTAACFFGAYLMFRNGWANLDEVKQFEGVITEKGITNYQTSTSGRYKITMTNQAFYLKIKGLEELLGVYNPKQMYDSLDHHLHVGDTIKVFYNHSNLPDQLNLETFQIEKNGKLILNREDFQRRERIGFYMTFIGGFVLLFLTFYQDRKFKPRK